MKYKVSYPYMKNRLECVMAVEISKNTKFLSHVKFKKCHARIKCYFDIQKGVGLG